MNVVHLLSGREGGGIRTAISNILPGLEIAGIQSSFLLLSPGSSLIQDLKSEGHDVATLRKYFRGDLSLAWRIARYCKRNNVDILHTHSIASNFYGRLARVFRPSIQVVTTVHAMTGDELKGATRLQAWANALRNVDIRFNNWSKRTIAVSEAVREHLISSGIPDERIDVIQHGIRCHDQPVTHDEIDEARKQWGFRNDDFVIGIVGRLTRVKNHNQFLDAGRIAIQNDPRIKLCIVGDGPLKTDLQQQAKSLGIAEQTVFTGWVHPVFPLVSGMQAKVMCSTSEGFGIALLEAMLCEVPVIASRVSQIPSIVVDGQTGLLVPPNSMDALADAMVRLASDSELHAQMKTAARLHVLDKFPIEREVQDTAAVYQNLTTTPGIRTGH